jgi:dienelactone hydrolase
MRARREEAPRYGGEGGEWERHDGHPPRGVVDLWGAAAQLERTAEVPAGRVGLLGIGLGGLDAWTVARAPGTAAPHAIVLYGTQPGALTGAGRVGAAVQAHYGARDRRAVADLPALDQRLRAAGSVYALHLHAGAGRSFWNEPAAGAATWAEMLRWFRTHLVPRGREAVRHAPGAGACSGAKPD